MSKRVIVPAKSKGKYDTVSCAAQPEFVAMPEYSSERYYLLSEIEEHCKAIVCFDDTDWKFKAGDSSSEMGKVIVHYITWDMQGGVDVLNVSAKKHISQCGGSACLSKHAVVVIDALFSSSDYSTVMVKNAVKEALASLRKGIFAEAGSIVIGVSNSNAAAPGLELIHDHLSMQNLEDKRIDWSVLCMYREHFLGHTDITVTPEAVSNVIQFYIASPSLEVWLLDVCGIDMNEKKPASKDKTESTEGKSGIDTEQGMPADVIRMQFIIFALLSAFLYWLATSSTYPSIENSSDI